MLYLGLQQRLNFNFDIKKTKCITVGKELECFDVRLKVGNTYPCNTSTVQVQYTRGDTDEMHG